jgi:hypothetical protein
MTEPAPLTADDIWRLLAQLGCTSDDEPPRCPLCKTAELTITANGSGPHLTCARGCGHIGAYLQTIASLPGGPKGEHVDKLAVLRDKLALPELRRVVKHGRRGDEYELHLEDGAVVELGPVAVILTQNLFRAAFLPQVRRNPPRYKPAVWDQISELIEQAAEEIETATGSEETIGWLMGYLRQQTIKRGVDLGDPAELYPVLKASHDVFADRDGCLHLRLAPFVQWLNRMAGVRVTVPALSTRLTALGFRRAQHAARQGEQTTRGRYWTSPPDLESTLW